MTTSNPHHEGTFFGAEDAQWASSWLEDLLECASVDELQSFVESRTGPDAAASAEDFLMLKALVHAVYEVGCAPSEEGWRRVRLALSAIRPEAVQQVEEAMSAT